MERLEISDEGTFTLPEGDVVAFIRYLEAHGMRCDPTGMTSSDESNAPVLQGHVNKPFDPGRLQELYRDWISGGRDNPNRCPGRIACSASSVTARSTRR